LVIKKDTGGMFCQLFNQDRAHSRGLFLKLQWTFGFHKSLGNSCVAGQILYFQGWLGPCTYLFATLRWRFIHLLYLLIVIITLLMPYSSCSWW